MNMPEPARIHPDPIRPTSRCGGFILGGLLLSLAALPSALGEPTVRTLGGGRLTPSGPDAGFLDGDILQVAQFNQPRGCAVDLSGRIYVADFANGALRRLDIAENRSRTILQGLRDPVAVAVDSAGAVFILTQSDGALWKHDRGVTLQVAAGLITPNAMAFDGEDTLLVTQQGGTVVKVNLRNGSVSSPILSNLEQPSGIAVLDSGFIAVSETGGNSVSLWDAATGALHSRIGTGTSGFADGPARVASFNRPKYLAKGPGGSLVLADQGNHRVRLIDADGFVSTIYGVDPAAWEGPACTSCDPIILPGWLDGNAEFAEARDPVGVTVSQSGTIYTTENFYHLVREVTGAVFTGGGDGGATNTVVLPPVISPATGYFPMGQTIAVSNPNVSSFLPSAVYYTTDGTEPTTNSLRVAMDNRIGTILWQEKNRDLSSLRLKAFLGANASETVGGQPADTTEIGITQDLAAGIGSTMIVPVIVNLRTNDQFQSLQFRVEVTPETPGIPMIPETFDALPISTNDFIPLYTAESKGTAMFQALPYQFGDTRGLAITFLGTNANLMIKRFGAAAMLSLPIPPTAKIGDRYTIQVLNPSGTADGAEARVPVAPMAARTIRVSEARYLVGDSSPAVWYNASRLDASGSVQPGFGDGLVDNSDVNNAFAAALGYRLPYPRTDLFDSMDAFPEDTTMAAGGDGLIRFLDWQIILMRSLGLDNARWERHWSDGGIRVPTGPSLSGLADRLGKSLTILPGAVWTPQATLFAQPAENVMPGTASDIPIYVNVASGYELAGLAFRLSVQAEGTAPALESPVQFVPSPNTTAPAQSLAPAINAVLCGWPLVPSSSFKPALRGANLLGYARVSIPPTARAGHAYTVRFSNADGSPDLQTQFQFETRPASLWILGSASRPADVSSDEWKTRFFGSFTAEAAAANADPDGDGVENSAEYLAGTNPIDRGSFLHLKASPLENAERGVVLRWLSAPGKRYQIESASSLVSSEWTVVAGDVAGDGLEQSWTESGASSGASFYRIRLQSSEPTP